MALLDMKYKLINNAGMVLTVPDLRGLNYQGLDILGNKSTNWNKPMQENFIKIVDRLEKCEMAS